MQTVHATDVLAGKDPRCANWLRRYREPGADGDDRRGRRETRRRRPQG
jgi:5-methyltetrahydrofolate--homocysteine methyltransferase